MLVKIECRCHYAKTDPDFTSDCLAAEVFADGALVAEFDHRERPALSATLFIEGFQSALKQFSTHIVEVEDVDLADVEDD